MIRDEDIEKHLGALEDLGAQAATARADADFQADFLKTVYAREYLASDLPRAADREAAAYASPRYAEALEEKRRAVALAERLRHERAWRERVIDAWQTMSANRRRV
ncbi:MAG: hypothetical protein ACO3WK_11400 [Steroidobacteraceae bacterium]|jgi:hypothetical protein